MTGDETGDRRSGQEVPLFPARVRGVALHALLDVLTPARRDLAFRVYVAMRRRRLPRDLAADLAARACTAADKGSDLASIAAELRVPVRYLVTDPSNNAPREAGR